MTVIKPAAGLPSLRIDLLRDVIYGSDPGCVCDPELFTGPAGIEPEDEPADEKAARIDAARDVCGECPVRMACLAFALRTRPAAGIWAGHTPEELTWLGSAARRPVKRAPARLPAREVA